MSNRLLVCTDLDRTLVPNGPEAESPGARAHFARLVKRAEVTFVMVTGRDRSLVESAIETYDLPIPDFVVSDVGTCIYTVGPPRLWRHQADWEREIAKDWVGQTANDLQHRLRDISDLRLQESSKQNNFKLSYYTDSDVDCEQLSAMIRARLDAEQIRARLVWSIDQATNVGLLDVIPARASKFHAIESLMKSERFDEGEVVFCGDSGNDMEVLESPLPAVLVANATEDVRQEALSRAIRRGHELQLYLARGGFLGMNGFYAAGILEGIAHFHPETVGWMEFSGERPAR